MGPLLLSVDYWPTTARSGLSYFQLLK